MLLATPENMEKCKDIPGVVALDTVTGDELSATVGDYYFQSPNEPLYSVFPYKHDLVLAVKVCKWVDPISGEDISAQDPADSELQDHQEETRKEYDNALGQTRN